MLLVPEVVQEILSFLPKQTYNQVYGINEIPGIYDIIPKHIQMYEFCNRWSFKSSDPSVRFFKNVEELVLFHNGFPLFPTNQTITLLLNCQNFLLLHNQFPDILRSYNLKVYDATLELNELDVSGYRFEFESVSSSTGSYGCKFANDLTVDSDYKFISKLEGPWKKVNIVCKPGSDFDFNRIAGWDVPNFDCLTIKNGGKLLRDFKCPLNLKTLELKTDFNNLPVFKEAALKRLSLQATIGTSQEPLNIVLPESLEMLEIHNGYSEDYKRDLNINYNSALKCLSLSHFVKCNDIPLSLTKLKLNHCNELRDFTKFQCLKDLDVQYVFTYYLEKISLPLSLLKFKTNAYMKDIQDSHWLKCLDSLYASIDESDDLVCPPNVTSLFLIGHGRISSLLLGNRLRILEINGFLLNPIEFPNSLRFLSLYEYSYPLGLPPKLDYFRIRDYSLALKTPETLRYLIVDRESARGAYVGMDRVLINGVVKAKFQLNRKLKCLVLNNFEIDFEDFFLPSLEVMVLSNCKFDLNKVDMQLAEEYEAEESFIFKKRINL